MAQNMYSIKQTAQILNLHPKTVRRFIREGKITAVKIGREWRISQENLKEYAHAELALPKEANKTENKDISNSDAKAPSIHVSTVIEMSNTDSEEASRISNSLIALLNNKDPAWGQTRYDFDYQPETQRARFILYGSPAFLRSILQTFEYIAQNK